MTYNKKAISIVLSIILVFIISSCPTPFVEEMLTEAKDSVAPAVSIDTPDNNSVFNQNVEVSGTVSDEGGEISTLSFEIRDSLRSLKTESIPLNEISGTGEFSFTFSTTDYNSDIIIIVTTADWNGNSNSANISLEYPGSPVSSFSVVPGNKDVKISWEAVPSADKYTIYYTDNGFPSENYGEIPVVLTESYSSGNPFVLTGLTNGNSYTFLLKAENTSSTSQWASDYCEAIPLSSLSLTPQVRSDTEAVYLNWFEIDPDQSVQVWRATGTGEYLNISGNYFENSYTDTYVSPGVEYSYKIIPSLPGSVESEAVTVELFPFNSSDFMKTPISTKAISGAATSIILENSNTFLGAGTDGVYKVDVSTSVSPGTPVNYFRTGCEIRSFDIEGDFLYAADYGEGLEIWNVGGSTASVRDTYVPASNGNRIADVLWDNDFLYVALPSNYLMSGSGVIEKLDVADEWNILLDDTYTKTGSIADYLNLEMHSSGSYIFATYFDDSYSKGIDIIYTDNMTNVGTLPDVVDVAVQENFFYVIDGTGLIIYEFSGAGATTSFTKRGSCNTNGTTKRITVNGVNAYVTVDNESGMQIINISNPDLPVLTDFYDMDNVSGVAAEDNYVYISDYSAEGGLTILQLSDFFSLTNKSNNPVTASKVGTAAVNDNYAFVANSSNDKENRTMYVYDISNPESPVQISSFDTEEQIKEIRIYGSHAYMSFSNTVSDHYGLEIIDISNPAPGWTPESRIFNVDNEVLGLDVAGGYAYLANRDYGLTIVDISDPIETNWQPEFTRIDTTGKINYCRVDGDRLILFIQGYGIQIMDISDPLNAEFLGIYSMSNSTPVYMDVLGGYAYVGDQVNKLCIIDLSEPAGHGWTPDVYYYQFQTYSNSFFGMSAIGDHLYVSYQDSSTTASLMALNISNPEAPYRVGKTALADDLSAPLWTDGSRILVTYCDTSSTGGFEIFELTE